MALALADGDDGEQVAGGPDLPATKLFGPDVVRERSTALLLVVQAVAPSVSWGQLPPSVNSSQRALVLRYARSSAMPNARFGRNSSTRQSEVLATSLLNDRAEGKATTADGKLAPRISSFRNSRRIVMKALPLRVRERYSNRREAGPRL